MVILKDTASRLILVTALLSCLALLAANRALAEDWIYVVSDGDNLWNLSEKYLGAATDWTRVQRVNQLPDPNWIKPGTRLRIPMAWIASNGVPAQVRALQGEVRLARKSSAGTALAVGDLLQLGDRVSTGAAASVTIEFADQSLITMEGDSELSLDHLSAYGETGMVDSRLRLLKGRLETHVTPMSGPGSRFEIHTTSAITAVRGTAYRMNVSDQQQASAVEVTGGTVDVSDAAVTENALVRKGFGTLVAAGEPPQPPRPLLPAPEFVDLPEKLDRISWPLNWGSVPGAKGYRLQLADEPGFETIRWQKLADNNSARLPDLPDGKFYLRLRAIDALGLEGLDQVTTIVQDARPQPPVPVRPGDNAVFIETAPDLTWSRSQEASTYRLQIASKPEFDSPVLDRSGLQTPGLASPEAVGLGDWYWRVASIAADGEQGPYGAMRRFTVKATPATPEATTSAGEDAMTVSWRSGGPGETYRVQIARDKRFRKIVTDRLLTEPELTLDYVSGGARYLRIQAIDADGDSSAWGTTQEIPALPDTSWKWALGTYLTFILLAF